MNSSRAGPGLDQNQRLLGICRRKAGPGLPQSSSQSGEVTSGPPHYSEAEEVLELPGRECTSVLYVCVALHVEEVDGSSFLMGGGGGGGEVYAGVGGRLSAPELFRGGHKPGPWA